MRSRTTILRNSRKYTANEIAVTPTDQDIQQRIYTLQELIIRLNGLHKVTERLMWRPRPNVTRVLAGTPFTRSS